MLKRLSLAISTLLLASVAYAVSNQPRVLIGTAPSTRANFTADANGSAVCFDAADSDFKFYLDADFVSGSSTLDVKIQESDGSSTWKDTSVAFTQVTTTDGTQLITTSGVNFLRCLRAVVDVGAAGSPNYNVLVRAYTRKRS